MRYTVKQISKLAGVSVRTLHYYDKIGLLHPQSVGLNGYRYYDERALLRLQQVLFYRELDISLSDIQCILDRPGFDVVQALQEHRCALQERVERLSRLIRTVDQTMLVLQGVNEMKADKLFEGWSEEKQPDYEREISERYGDKLVKESNRRWSSYTNEEKERIKQTQQQLHRDLAANIDKGYASPEVQALVARWHQNLRYFYEPTPEMLRGLGQMYVDDPRFAAMYRQVHAGLPEFFNQAIQYYCDHLKE